MRLHWQDSSTQKQVIEALQRDEILITTTDTVPGLLANVTRQGFDKLNQIKGGRQDKPYIVLVSDMSKLGYFLGAQGLPLEIQKIIHECWPGPLTVVFKASSQLPTFLKSKEGNIAVRCPGHHGLLGVLQNFQGLFSTSANKTGVAQPASIADVAAELILEAGLVVDDKDGGPQQQSSTILDCSRFDQDKKIYLLRQGAYSLPEIEKVGGIKIHKSVL
jgi:L-threonylcarbamoyladenylate synthase